MLVLETRTAESTGADLVLVETSDELPEALDWDRFVAICDTHESYSTHDSQAEAHEALSEPEEWCRACDVAAA